MSLLRGGLAHRGTWRKHPGICREDTPPENERLEPENEDLEDEFPFQKGDFQVPCWFSGEYQIPPLKLTLQFAPENRPKPKKEAGSFLPTINFQVGNCWFQGGVFDDDT